MATQSTEGKSDGYYDAKAAAVADNDDKAGSDIQNAHRLLQQSA